MTEISKAAQQALDALIYHVEQTRPIERTTQAITALRAALQDKAGEPVAWEVWWGVCDMQPCPRPFHSRAEAEEYASSIKSNTEVRPLFRHAAQPAPVVPDDHPLVVFAKECRLGAYTEREVIQEAGKALAASQQNGSAG